MKCFRFGAGILVLVGCGGGNELASLVGQIETASLAGSGLTLDRALRKQRDSSDCSFDALRRLRYRK